MRAYAEAPAKADWWNEVLSERMLVLLIVAAGGGAGAVNDRA